MFTLANLLTASNLFLGCCALVSLSEGNFKFCIFFVILAAIADFFDGFIARKLNQDSALGAQLDSLSDIVTFGVVPGMICFQILNTQFPDSKSYAYLGFLIAIMAAFRLARFNVESKGTDLFFKGLPVPANAIFFIGLLDFFHQDQTIYTFIFNPIVFIMMIIIFSYLMISKLKVLKIHPSKNWMMKYGYLIVLEFIILLSGYWFGFVVLSIIVIIHILFSSYYHFFNKEISNT